MSGIKSNCERVRTKSKGKTVTVNYSRPMYDTDLKREGRFIRISTRNASLKLDGKGINAIKKALVDAGEVEALDWQEEVLQR